MFFYFDGRSAAHNLSCRSNDSTKQSGSFEAYHHGSRDNRAQEAHAADTCQCADQEKSCVATIQNIRSAAVLFFQLRPFIPFGFEMLTNPRDLLKAVGLVRGRALANSSGYRAPEVGVISITLGAEGVSCFMSVIISYFGRGFN